MSNDSLAIAIKSLIASTGKAPDWRYPRKSLKTLDYAGLGITISEVENDEPIALEWCGHIYTRADVEGEIYFSRMVNLKEQAILITFVKPLDIPQS